MKELFKIVCIVCLGFFYACNKDDTEQTYPPTPPKPSYPFNGPFDLALDNNGNIFVTNNSGFNVLEVPVSGAITAIVGKDTAEMGCGGDGGLAKYAYLDQPEGVTLDKFGNIYFADAWCERIRKVTISTGTISTVAGDGSNGIGNFSGDGGPATNAAISYPWGVAVDTSGNVYLTDKGNNRIRKVDGKTGIITTIAGTGNAGFSGDGGPATLAEIKGPTGIVIDDSNNVYFSDFLNNRIRKISFSTGSINTLINPSGASYLAVDSVGNIYYTDSFTYSVYKYDTKTKAVTTIGGNGTSGNSGDGGPAINAQLNSPSGIVYWKGNLYITDQQNNNIRKVNLTTGIITTVAHN
jgi:sugar lactone lactonase YvrE